MDVWIMNALLGISLLLLLFLAYINWRILIITETIARSTGLFLESLVEKSVSKSSEESEEDVDNV